jgi:hypothetical protein
MGEGAELRIGEDGRSMEAARLGGQPGLAKMPRRPPYLVSTL